MASILYRPQWVKVTGLVQDFRCSGPSLVQEKGWHLLNTKPLPEPIRTYHQIDPNEQISVSFQSKLKYLSLKKKQLKISAKCRLAICLYLNVLTTENSLQLTNCVTLEFKAIPPKYSYAHTFLPNTLYTCNQHKCSFINHQISNISGTFVGNKTVDHSDVVGA